MNHRLSSRYFIRFDRLILVHVAAHYYIFLRDDLVHGAMVSNFCSSVASPPFFSSSFSFPRFISPYFFAYRPPLFFYILFLFFFLYISRRYYAAKMIEFRCVALVAQLKPTHDAATAFEKRNFQELLFVTCSSMQRCKDDVKYTIFALFAL